jgi:hypothetical protein
MTTSEIRSQCGSVWVQPTTGAAAENLCVSAAGVAAAAAASRENGRRVLGGQSANRALVELAAPQWPKGAVDE